MNTRKAQEVSKAPPGLPSVESGFQFDPLAPLLRNIATQIEAGFTLADANSVVKLYRSMDDDQERILKFNVQYDGKTSELYIRLSTDVGGVHGVTIFADRALFPIIEAAHDADRKEVDRAFNENRKLCGQEYKWLQQELRKRGHKIKDLDATFMGDLAPEIVPDLIDLLPKVKYLADFIARALADPVARGVAVKPLVRALKSCRERDPEGPRAAPRVDRWAFGLAIAAVAEFEHVDQLLESVVDERFGEGRAEIISNLWRFKKHRKVVQTLLSLLDDQQVVGNALAALARLKEPQARPKAQALLKDKRLFVRSQAKKLLDSIGKNESTSSAKSIVLPEGVRLVKKIPATLAEASANYDLAEIGPALRRVAALFDSGFGPHELRFLLKVAKAMRREDEKHFQLTVTRDGKRPRLIVGLFMDDVDAPDLFIHAPLALAKQIRKIL